MERSANDREKSEKRMDSRLKKCIQKLQEIKNTLKANELTDRCYEEAKQRIGNAMELVAAFKDSPMDTEDAEKEKLANDALKNAELYLELELFQELASLVQKIVQRDTEFKETLIAELEKVKNDESDDIWVHILHLSDLHFGMYMEGKGINDFRSDRDRIDRQKEEDFFAIVGKPLLDFFRDYKEAGGKINIVAITGDIAFRAEKREYNDFRKWLKELCAILDVKIEDHVVMCPGNHDNMYRLRSQHGMRVKKDKTHESEDILTINAIENRANQFRSFNGMCRSLKIRALTNFSDPKAKNAVGHTMGIKKIDGINFVVLNSVWNSFPGKPAENGSDHGQLVLGRRLIESLYRNPSIPDEEMTVMLFHHPLAWLHETEIRLYGKDQSDPSAALVKQKADIILNGHVHGGIEPPDILANKTVVFGGGTLCSNDSPIHQFEIISVNRTKHYCIQQVVQYNRQTESGHSRGWELISEKHPPKIYYGIYRDVRDMALRCVLGEVTRDEARQEISERLKEVGVQAFDEVIKRTKDYQILDIIARNKEIEKALYGQNTISNSLEASLGKSKTLA